MHKYIKNITTNLIQFLSESGFSEAQSSWMGQTAVFFGLLVVAIIAFYITRKLVRSILIPIISKSENKFDDLLISHKFFSKLSYLVPVSILYTYYEDVTTSPVLEGILHVILETVYVVVVVLIVNSIISTASDMYHRFEYARNNPMKALFQVVKIITWFVGILVVVGVLFEKDLGTLIVSLGAVSAVLLLIFKDPILGLVGGFQLIFNKMVAIGDWIEMSQFGADGEVLEINLTTVKVQNWDKTIVTIPTYALISDAFRNWRGMEESGGRRIKRSINIDIDSVRFLDENDLETFNKIVVLKPYLEKKAKELAEYNEEFKTDPSSIVNGRRQTNIGVFRAYLEYYLQNRPEINTDMTFLVRQLQPTDKGLPIEIYIFTKSTEWAVYESIQGNIFDHVMAAIPQFGLRVFQSPSSRSFEKLNS